MKVNLTTVALTLFLLSVVLWITLTLFESVLVGISLMTERVITFLALILPAGIGAALGTVSLLRRDGRRGLTIISVLLNSLFALFHLMVLAFAG